MKIVMATLVLFFVGLYSSSALPTRGLVASIESIRSKEPSDTYFNLRIPVGSPPKFTSLVIDTTARLSLVSCPERSKPLFVHAALTFKTFNGNDVMVQGLDVGCIDRNPLESYALAALGPGPAGLPAQVASMGNTSHKFTYCLGRPNNKGFLLIGEVSSILKKSFFTYVPLKLGLFEGYTVIVKGIRMQDVSGSNSTWMAVKGIDSTVGTVARYTRLPEEPYQQVVQHLKKNLSTRNIKTVRYRPYELDLCYNMTSRDINQSPTMKLLLQDDKTWTILPGNYFVRTKWRNVYCLGLLNAGDQKYGAIIGTLLQEETLIEFDIQNKHLGLSESLLALNTDCTNLNPIK